MNFDDREAHWMQFAKQIDGSYSTIHETLWSKLIKIQAPLEQSTITFVTTELEIHVVVPFVFKTQFAFEAIHRNHIPLFRQSKFPELNSGAELLDTKYIFSSNDSASFVKPMSNVDLASSIFSTQPKMLSLSGTLTTFKAK